MPARVEGGTESSGQASCKPGSFVVGYLGDPQVKMILQKPLSPHQDPPDLCLQAPLHTRFALQGRNYSRMT